MHETCKACGTQFAVGILACPNCSAPLEESVQAQPLVWRDSDGVPHEETQPRLPVSANDPPKIDATTYANPNQPDAQTSEPTGQQSNPRFNPFADDPATTQQEGGTDDADGNEQHGDAGQDAPPLPSTESAGEGEPAPAPRGRKK